MLEELGYVSPISRCDRVKEVSKQLNNNSNYFQKVVNTLLTLQFQRAILKYMK